MIVRNAKFNECKIISDIGCKTYTKAFGGTLDEVELEEHLVKEKSENYFKSRFNLDMFLVAEVRNSLVGYLQVTDMNLRVKDFIPILSGQLINAVYVNQDFQGSGIATQLIESALNSKRILKAPCVYVDVWELNLRAIGLYKRFGFEVAGKCDVDMAGRVIGEDMVMVRNH